MRHTIVKVPKNVQVPKSKINFANTPTPLEPWRLNFGNSKFFIKRDDLTGTDLTGNKVRKLEFLLADAIENNCDTVIAWVNITNPHPT